MRQSGVFDFPKPLTQRALQPNNGNSPPVDLAIRTTADCTRKSIFPVPSVSSVVSFVALPHDHPPQNLFHNLRRDGSRHSRNVLHGVVLNHIRPHNLTVNRMQVSDGFPHRHPSRLAM